MLARPADANVFVMPMLPLASRPDDIEKAWFDRVGFYDETADEQRMLALVTRCLGDRECPTPAEWIGLVLVGAYSASLTGHYPSPPEGAESWSARELQGQTWGFLLTTATDHRPTANEELMALYLRWFMPRYRYADGPREMGGGGYYQSLFASNWRFWVANRMKSVNYLNPGRRKAGQSQWDRLPREFQETADKVAECTPKMLELVLPIVRRKFYW